MVLIINEALLRDIGITWGIASKLGISIEKRILSIPYDLVSGNIVNAEIMNIENIKDEKEFVGLKGEKIKLVLIKGTVSKDYLLIHKDDWPKLRDYGVLADEVIISFKIDEVLKGSESMKIYSKGNVEVNG